MGFCALNFETWVAWMKRSEIRGVANPTKLLAARSIGFDWRGGNGGAWEGRTETPQETRITLSLHPGYSVRATRNPLSSSR